MRPAPGLLQRDHRDLRGAVGGAEEAATLRTGARAYVANLGKVIEAFRLCGTRTLSQQKETHKVLDDQTDAIKYRMFGASDRLTAHYKLAYAASNAVLEAKLRETFVLLALSTLVATGAALGIGLAFAKRLTGVINALAAVAEGIAYRGDLEGRANVDRDDELGHMARSFDAMSGYLRNVAHVADALARGDLDVEITPMGEQDILGRACAVLITNLRGVVGVVRDNSDAVAAASTRTVASAKDTAAAMTELATGFVQVDANSRALAAGVNDTASAIGEMAASVEEVAGSAESLGASVNRSSDSIQEMAASIIRVAGDVAVANAVVDQAAAAAAGGSQAVAQSIVGMRTITDQMGEVMGVIEGLGRRSEEIGEIAELISKVQEETELAIRSTKASDAAIQDGVSLTRQAGDALEDIVAAVGNVATLMDQIGVASREQSLASAQIAADTVDMNRLTTHVATATREQARTSEQITRSVAAMSMLTQQVSLATHEQKRSGELVALALGDIDRTSRELHAQAGSLQASVAYCKGGPPAADAAPPSEPPIELRRRPRAA